VSQRRAIITATVLWLVLAFVVWNVIFDRILVLAGRRYSYEAAITYRTTGKYLLINDVMRPAIAHGVRVASVAAVGIAVAGLVLIRVAANADAKRRR
jgi:hypothetical protein